MSADLAVHEDQRHRLHRWFVTAVAVVLLGTVMAVGAPSTAGGSAANRPHFQLPFTCGQTWWGATYASHSQYWAVDFNTFNGDAWELGQPVLASASGTVVVSAWHQNSWGGGYGHYVVVDHGNRWATLHAHLESRAVTVGQQVAMGTLLGGVGGTPSYPVHLHYEQRYDDPSTGVAAVPAVFDGVAFTYTEFDLANGYQGLSLTSNNCLPTFDPCGTFADVADTSQFCPAILWLVDSGLATGHADGTFRPTDAVSRQAMASFLWKRGGSGAATVPGPFSDVGADHPFAQPVSWVSEAEIASGYEDGTFGAIAPVSRQAMASFLWRAAGRPSPPVGSPTFVDVSPDHPFGEPITWLAGVGISTGYDDGTFRPGAAVSRQAMAAFLERAR